MCVCVLASIQLLVIVYVHHSPAVLNSLYLVLFCLLVCRIAIFFSDADDGDERTVDMVACPIWAYTVSTVYFGFFSCILMTHSCFLVGSNFPKENKKWFSDTEA